MCIILLNVSEIFLAFICELFNDAISMGPIASNGVMISK
jgi:hypothetical protein